MHVWFGAKKDIKEMDVLVFGLLTYTTLLGIDMKLFLQEWHLKQFHKKKKKKK